MMLEQVHYVTNEDGEPVGVLLDLSAYRRLVVSAGDPDLLTGLSREELEALAQGKLAPAAQARLDDLLERRQEGGLSAAELEELDSLLLQVDRLTTLKTRARYTLQELRGSPLTIA